MHIIHPSNNLEPHHDMQHTHSLASTSAHVSLSGLLNVLNRIGAQDGRVLFTMTTKHSSLDLVLC